jgi:Ca2+-binding RTX toxin-like protein
VFFGGDGNDNFYINGSLGPIHASLVGGNGDDRLTGGAGNDTIDGGSGRDWINGSDGNDSITGGADGDVLGGDKGKRHDLRRRRR